MNEIAWKLKAVKQLRRIDRKHQGIIRDAVNELKFFPDVPNVRRLTNHHYTYRLKVGNYRVFFEYEKRIRVIKIEEVKKRDDRTY